MAVVGDATGMAGAQNSSPSGNDVGLVSALREAGLTIMQLTDNNLSLIGTGRSEGATSGISRPGRQVIADMNRWA